MNVMGKSGLSIARLSWLCLLVCLATVSCSKPAAPEADGAHVAGTEQVGWLEVVQVADADMWLKAKLDTGAYSSSIHTTKCQIEKIGGVKWVQFTVSNKKQEKELRARLLKMVKIKEHDGSYQTRPVVKLKLKFGKKLIDAEVNLVDRSSFIYPLLLGRNFIKNNKLAIDPARTYTIPPHTIEGK